MPLPPPPAYVIGVNLDANADWNTAHIWADAARDFRQWGKVGEAQTANPSLSFTPDGYPLADADALSYLVYYPNGVYKLTYSGAGDVIVGGMGQIRRSRREGDTVTAEVAIRHDKPDGTGGTIVLGIRHNLASRPVHDIHLWAPGAVPGQVFSDEFLRRVKPFRGIRFMDWAATNNSPVVKWEDRTQPTSMIQTTKGVDWESVVALANATKRDPWINVPHAADDDYVKHLATLFRDKLDPSLKLRVEYSNEVWNGIFEQARWATQIARRNPKLTKPDDFGRSAEQYGLRAKEVGDIFRTVFGDKKSRVVFVLGGQNSNLYWAKTALDYVHATSGEPNRFFQELAIGPYIGNDLPAEAPPGGWTLDTLFPAMRQWTATTFAGWIRDAANLAKENGLTLVAYEGGQHLTGNPHLPDSLKVAAQNDPRMYDLYHQLFQVWHDNGGGLFEAFSHCGSGWGLLEAITQPGSRKWDAVMSQLLPNGDATLDGVVDYKDFKILQSHYKKPGQWWWEDGDFNGDNKVDEKDLELILANLKDLTAAQKAEAASLKGK